MEANIQTMLKPPKTCFDRENRSNLNYFFVSYSHKDQKLVFDMLENLYSLNVNYWYDVDLEPGDIWNERVGKIIKNPHCQGALIFMSEKSLVSKAVQQEIQLMQEIAKERNFRLIPIIMGFENASSLILHVAQNDEVFYQDGGLILFQSCTKNGLWVRYEDALTSVVQLAESQNVKEGHLVNVKRSFLTEINHTTKKGVQSFFCGQYPMKEDGVLQDIEWALICNKNEYYYLLSKYCIDFVNEKNVESTIESIKQTMKSDNYVEDVVLMNEMFLEDNIRNISDAVPSDYADRNRQQLLRLFWVLEGDGAKKDQYTLYNSQNVKICESIQRDKINAGVRLILIINNEKIGGK